MRARESDLIRSDRVRGHARKALAKLAVVRVAEAERRAGRRAQKHMIVERGDLNHAGRGRRGSPERLESHWSGGGLAKGGDEDAPTLGEHIRGPRAREGAHGTLTGPDVRDKPGSRSIRLAYVRLKSPADQPATPVIYLAGGPGQSSTGIADRPELFKSFAAPLQAALQVCDALEEVAVRDDLGALDEQVRPVLDEELLVAAELLRRTGKRVGGLK